MLWAKTLTKKCLKKIFLTFCMFFKFKGSILRFFFRFFFTFFLLFFNQRYKIGDAVRKLWDEKKSPGIPMNKKTGGTIILHSR